MTETVTKYIVTFTQTPSQPVMEGDDDTIWNVLDNLSDEEVDNILAYILVQKMSNGDREDMEDLMSYVFFNFVNTTSIEHIKKELIYDEMEWMCEMMDHAPGLAKGFTHWGIQMEVME